MNCIECEIQYATCTNGLFGVIIAISNDTIRNLSIENDNIPFHSVTNTTHEKKKSYNVA